MIIKILKKPHPFIFNKYSVLIPSIITFFLLVFLAPLQFGELELTARTLFSFAISCIVALSIGLTIKCLKKVSPKLMNEDNWTIGKEIKLAIITVFVMIVCISISLVLIQDNINSFFKVLLKTSIITIVISVFPITVLVLFEQFRHQKNQFLEAANLTKVLRVENNALRSKKSNNSINEKFIKLMSEKNEIELKLEINDLVYLKSDGNYIEVFFLNEDVLRKKLIRNRLKNIETNLPNHIFFRCHNSFIVNGNYIINVMGNARNLELEIKGIADKIPVSRTKTKAIDNFLKNL
mgnify:CR=1 FL=1|tara:strand:- start:14484 stop:15362 length:879 start_codon:yes stop_codon:yes gene_type:complete